MTLEQRKQILYEIGDLRYKNYDSQAYFDKQQRANLSNLQQLDIEQEVADICWTQRNIKQTQKARKIK